MRPALDRFLSWLATIDDSRTDRVATLARAVVRGESSYADADLVAAVREYRREQGASARGCLSCGAPVVGGALLVTLDASGASTWHAACRLAHERDEAAL